MYNEFIAHTWIKEPWNALSSIIFFIPVIYFAWRTNLKVKQYQLWYMVVPFLVINGIGSTLYHAFRDSFIFRYMDFLGALTAAAIVMIVFWRYVFKSWWKSVVFLLVINVLRIPFWYLDWPQQWFLNTQYAITGILAAIPFIVYWYRNRGQASGALNITIVLMLTALIFRMIDRQPWQPLSMGTHWLWHLFTTLALFPLSRFLLIHETLLLTNEKDRAVSE